MSNGNVSCDVGLCKVGKSVIATKFVQESSWVARNGRERHLSATSDASIQHPNQERVEYGWVHATQTSSLALGF